MVCASLDMMKREGGRSMREDDKEVIANDRKSELRGRIDSGGRLGIVAVVSILEGSARDIFSVE